MAGRVIRPGSVAVGVPSVGPPTWLLVRSLLGLLGSCETFTFTRTEGLAVDLARTHLVEWFLDETDCEWHLQLDRDAVVVPQTAQRLMSWGKPLVGALCFTRYRPVVPTIYRERHEEHEDKYRVQIDETREWITQYRELWGSDPAIIEPRPEDALTPVDFTGMHCFLFHRSVFAEIEKPWFKNQMEKYGRYGEDRWFCERAKAAGLDIYVDRSVMAGHMYGEQSLGAVDFMVWDNSMNWKEMQIEVHDKRELKR